MPSNTETKRGVLIIFGATSYSKIEKTKGTLQLLVSYPSPRVIINPKPLNKGKFPSCNGVRKELSASQFSFQHDMSRLLPTIHLLPTLRINFQLQILL